MLYATKQDIALLDNKKIDKTSIASELSPYPSNKMVASEKLLSDTMKRIEYPRDMCKCIEEFDNMYLGYKATHPTMDINGKALSTGLMYYNTSDKMLYVYDGLGWRRTLSNIPFSIPEHIELTNFDVEVLSVTDTVTIPNGYNPASVVVFLNGFIMSTDDYIANDGTTIKFASPTLQINDIVNGFYASNTELKKFDIEVLATDDRVSVPNGYKQDGLAVYLNGIRMSTQDYIASDGNIIIFRTPTLQAGDVVSGYFVDKVNSDIPIVTEIDKIENATTPPLNGVIKWDNSRNEYFFYSASDGAWKGRLSNKEKIEFYDNFDDFPDKTIATLDKMYIDRSTFVIYWFDGTKYQSHGIITNLLPAKGSKNSLYIDTDNKVIRYWDGATYKTLVDGMDEEVQSKANIGDFIYTGTQELFIDTTTNRLYRWDGYDFIAISTTGAGQVEFGNNTNMVNEEKILFLTTDNGKLYYYKDNKKRRANKEVWRVADDADLNLNALRDEDFIYLVDDTNTLKKWDNGVNKFETLGTPKVTHHFVKDSEISYIGSYPNTTEIETKVNANGWSDCIVWGSGTDSETVTKWAYSIDSEGDSVLIYSLELKTGGGFAVFDKEQDIGNNQLRVTITSTSIIIKDGNGATLSTKDNNTIDDISNGSGNLMVSLNGIKVPYVDFTLSGNEVLISTSRVLPLGKVYQDSYIEITK